MPNLTVTDIAKKFNLDHMTVFRWVTKGLKGRKLRAVKEGHKYVVSDSDLVEFLISSRSKH